MIDPLPGDIFRQGQVLNHTYEIEGVLGRGGTGEVYRARNQISGRIVAIKALNAQFSGNDDYIQLMRREEQMRDVINDAVVRYSECSRTDQGHVFLVMDFIDGPSMNDIMMRRRMDARELMIIAHRVAEGLVAAHARGIVHRDLSPDNVVLRDGAPEKATIIDFGIAKDTSAGAKTIVGNEFAGKYEYAAPEQLEGRAEKRSDLYALGATLLAAYRGQVPFNGSTPGEIVRRKQTKLDTDGVPEPLKGLLDWLTAPALADRAPSAEAVVDRLVQALKPVSTRGARKASAAVQERAPRSGSLALLVVLLLGLGGGGAWYAGLFGGLAPPPVPAAAPYRLNASLGPTGSAFTANAPDEPAAALLRQAFARVAGTPAAEGAVSLASGIPGDRWIADVVTGLGLMQGLAEWTLDISDTSVRITGLADNRDVAGEKTSALSDWARQAGFAARVDIVLGPRLLPVPAVEEIIQPFATCGPLGPDQAPAAPYGLGETVVIAGALETEADRDKLQEKLEAGIGDRQLRIDATILNADLCAIRKVLPPLESGDLTIWLGDGATGEVNLSGIYRAGDNPIVEVLAPADLTGLSLWVVVVDNQGAVYNLLPNIKQEEHDLSDVGTVENGQRQIRVLHSMEDLAQKRGYLGITVDKDSFGKSEVIAILSRTSLFGIRRPKDESTASFADALAEILREEPGNIVSIATRVIDARP